MFDCIWFWRAKLPDRKGERCRVVARSRVPKGSKWRANSVLVEFSDGWRVVTSRYAVRKIKEA